MLIIVALLKTLQFNPLRSDFLIIFWHIEQFKCVSKTLLGELMFCVLAFSKKMCRIMHKTCQLTLNNVPQKSSKTSQ